MKTAKDVLKAIKDNDVKYVDLRFTDPRGKWQHVTFDVSLVDEDFFADGHDVRRLLDRRLEGDQRVRHDADARPRHRLHRPVLLSSHAVHLLRRPRAGDRRALQPRPARHRQEGRGLPQVDRRRRHGLFGPEAEFFIFDDVRFTADPYNTGFKLDTIELPTNGDTDYEGGNLGHRVRTKGGYFPVPPQDSAQDMRGEMLAAMAEHGRQGGEAPPRGGLGPARARHEVRHR